MFMDILWVLLSILVMQFQVASIRELIHQINGSGVKTPVFKEISFLGTIKSVIMMTIIPPICSIIILLMAPDRILVGCATITIYLMILGYLIWKLKKS